MPVLLATDHKPHTEKAEDYAIRYAKAFDLQLQLITVMTPVQDMDSEPLDDYCCSKLEELSKKASMAGVETVTSLEYGLPAERIMDYAERCEADVIIVGTSKRSTLSRVIMGSVSDKVVRNAGTTVVVVR